MQDNSIIYEINHIFLLNLDNILSNISRETFWELDEGQYRILNSIAKKGPMNLSEIGELTSSKKFANGFDRWGVKQRLYGSSYYIGLISNDYVFESKINKKENRYHLTLKGLISSLSTINFDDHYLVKRYSKTLSKYTKQSNIKNILNYIKLEIAYFLFCNTILGFNLRKFKFLKKYLDKNRYYEKANFHLDFGIEETDLKKNKSTFNKLEIEYGKSYRFAIWSASYQTTDQVFSAWKKSQIKKIPINPKVKEIVALNNYNRYWHHIIDLEKIDMNTSEQVWFFLNTNGFDARPKIINMKKPELDALFQNRQNRRHLTSFLSFIRIN